MNQLAGTTGILVGLLGLALLVAIAAERLRIPGAVALVLSGAVFAAVHPVRLPFQFGDALLFVFLPPLIFEAAWNIDVVILRRTALRIAVLAGPGVALTALLIALGLAAFGVLPFGAALVVGTIVAATDPVAVLAVFRRLPVPADLRMIVEGESIANDGVAIVLYGVALSVAAGVPVAGWPVALHVIVSIAGGCAIGILSGVVVAAVIGRTGDAALEITGTIVLAFLAYLAANALGLSGVFATAAAGIVLRMRLARRPGLVHAAEVDSFWSAIAFVANAFVFIATGLIVPPERLVHEPRLVFIAIALTVLVRVVLVATIERRPAWTATLLLAGMRGGLGLALALILPATLPERPRIIDAVLGVVVFTLVVQGVALEPVLRRLRFYKGIGGPSLSS